MICLMYLIGALSILSFAPEVRADDTDTMDEVGLTTSELIRLRGFEAEDFYIVSGQGYVLNVVEATNPKIPKESRRRVPVLFVHGTITSASCFVVNSVGATPRNLSDLYERALSDEELIDLIGEDPNSKSLVYSALNAGFVVYLVNLRGTRASLSNIQPDRQPFYVGSPKPPVRGIADLLDPMGILSSLGDFAQTLLSPITSVLGIEPQLFQNYTNFLPNRKYWNYSMDEEAREDVPNAIKFVLRRSNSSQLALVGHSSGAALILMSMSIFPELSDTGEFCRHFTRLNLI